MVYQFVAVNPIAFEYALEERTNDSETELSSISFVLVVFSFFKIFVLEREYLFLNMPQMLTGIS